MTKSKKILFILFFLFFVGYFAYEKFLTTKFLNSLIGQRRLVSAKVIIFLKPSIIRPSGDGCAPPLHVACHLGEQSLVQLIIESGGSLEEISHFNSNYTSLHVVVASGNLELLKFLVSSQKVNLNVLNGNGETLLHTAVEFHNVEMLTMLLKFGVNPNKADAVLDQFPIHRAAMRENPEIAKILVNYGARLDKQDYYKFSPLHWAAVRGCLEVVKFLVSKGCDPHQVQRDGKTPIDLAIQEGYTEVADYLKNQK